MIEHTGVSLKQLDPSSLGEPIYPSWTWTGQLPPSLILVVDSDLQQSTVRGQNRTAATHRPQTSTSLIAKCRSILKKMALTASGSPQFSRRDWRFQNAQSRIRDLIVNAIGYSPMINAAMLTSIKPSLNVHIGDGCLLDECGEVVCWIVLDKALSSSCFVFIALWVVLSVSPLGICSSPLAPRCRMHWNSQTTQH